MGGADALNNDLIYQVANPLEVEGKEFAPSMQNDTSIEDTSNTASTSNEDCKQHTIAPNKDIKNVDAEMQDIFQNTDDEWIASLIDEIENDRGNVSKISEEAEEPDLLKMVIDDSIGVQTLAQQLNTPLETLNINDIFSLSEIDTAPVVPSCTQEDTRSHMEISDEPMKKPRGRGRPRKERSAIVVKRSRGRPSKLPSNVNDVMAAHHNYSYGGAVNSTLTTDERRYRRMRDLNNVASQRCGLKRKEKMHGAVSQLKEEEEKNKLLTMRVRLLEEQVLALKEEFKKRVANPRMILVSKTKVPTKETAAAKPALEWDDAELEKFLDETAGRHLTN